MVPGQNTINMWIATCRSRQHICNVIDYFSIAEDNEPFYSSF